MGGVESERRQKMVNEAAAEHSGHTAIDHDAHKDNDTMAVVTIGNMTQLEVSRTSRPRLLDFVLCGLRALRPRSPRR